MASPLLPGELRAPRAPRLSPSPVLPGELSWPELSFSSLEEAEAFALLLEKNLRLLEERASPSRLREDALKLEEEASSFLSALERERCLAHIAPDIRMQASQLRERALELRTIAKRREALQAQLEESLEELERLIAELRWPLLAR
jgi:hypothetical protein